MKKLITAFSLVVISVSNSMAQFDNVYFKENVRKYYQLMNKGIECNIEEKMDSAIFFSLQALDCIEPFSEDIFILSSYYHKKGDYKNAVKYYYKAVQSGYLPIDDNYAPYYMIENNSIKEYKVVLSRLDSLKYYPTCRIDFEFSNLLTRLFYKDQLVRFSHKFFEMDSVTKQDGKRLEEAYYKLIDKENIIELMEFIDKKGIPHYNSITAEGQNALTILLRHYIPLIDSPINKEFYKKIKSAIEAGILPNTKIRMAIDYYFTIKSHNQSQFFGSFTTPNKEGKREVSPPIDVIGLVDKRRAEWLYLPLEVQLRSIYGNDYVLPKAYVVDLKK